MYEPKQSEVEALARQLCKSDGNDPDEWRSTDRWACWRWEGYAERARHFLVAFQWMKDNK